MSFKDLDEVFRNVLPLPIGGKVYEIESPDAETGLFVQRMFAVQAKAAAGKVVSDAQLSRLELDDDEETTLYERLLGDALDDMTADGVRWEQVKLAGTAALLWVQGVDMDTIERFWNAGGRPEAEAPNREAKRAAARSTRRRASGSGTTRQQKALVQGEVVEGTPGEMSSSTGA